MGPPECLTGSPPPARPARAAVTQKPGTAVRRHVWVSGRVQGVGYRQSCAYRAGHLGVAGWVRNLPDGRVEAVFEGDPEPVGRLVEWCRGGPTSARVTGVKVANEAPEGLAGFKLG